MGFMAPGGDMMSPGTSGRMSPGMNGAGPSSEQFYYPHDSLSPNDMSYSPEGPGSSYDASPRGNFNDDWSDSSQNDSKRFGTGERKQFANQ